MKNKSFAKTSPQTPVLGLDPHIHAAKAVGETGRCKNIPGLSVTRKWLEMALSQFPGLQDWLAKKRDRVYQAGYVPVQVVAEPEPAGSE